jgi:hypothetical protein
MDLSPTAIEGGVSAGAGRSECRWKRLAAMAPNKTARRLITIQCVDRRQEKKCANRTTEH